MLQCLEAHATRSGRYIVPLLSLSIDFYTRVFVRVYTGQAKTKESTSKLGHVYQCTGCEMLATQRLGKVAPHENGKNLKYSLGKCISGSAYDPCFSLTIWNSFLGNQIRIGYS